MVQLRLKRLAEKELRKLPRKEQEKVIRKLHELELMPLAGKPLRGEYQGYYTFRAWPYRIIYKFEHDTGIWVYVIEHRQSVYK